MGMIMEKPVVFVVDDDESVCQALKRLMRSAGINARTLSSAEDFLNQGCHNVPGCLILDVRMPDRAAPAAGQQKCKNSTVNIKPVKQAAAEQLDFNNPEVEARVLVDEVVELADDGRKERLMINETNWYGNHGYITLEKMK